MTLSSAPRAVYIRGEHKIGIRPSPNVSPGTFVGPLNFTSIEITGAKQEFEKLISNMANSYGATLASVAKVSDPAKIKLESETMTPEYLALMLGADVSEVTQAASAVALDTIDTVLNRWSKLDNEYLEAHGTGTEIALKTSASVVVSADKYELDLVNGMVRPIHADAVGVGMKLSYSKSARTLERYLAGLAKSAYVQLSGLAVDKVSGKSGRLDIWCASLAASGAVQMAQGGYFKLVLEGDLVMPADKASPWSWEVVTE